MNFSLKQHTDYDVFAFFSQEQSISIPLDCWVIAIMSSLRMKKSVFILEKHNEVPILPQQDSRWLVHENYLYLSPRSGRVLFEAANLFSSDYKAIKSHLNTFK